jgi:hypothetical protein
VPEQKVSGANADYEDLMDDHPGEPYEYAGDIHSHASMGASHSGVDDADELGRLPGWHITIGHLDRPKGDRSYSCRVVFGGFTDEKLKLDKVFTDMPDETSQEYPYSHDRDWMNKVSQGSRSSMTVIGKNTSSAYGGSWSHGSSGYQPREKKPYSAFEGIGFRFDDKPNVEYIEAFLESIGSEK